MVDIAPRMVMGRVATAAAVPTGPGGVRDPLSHPHFLPPSVWFCQTANTSQFPCLGQPTNARHKHLASRAYRGVSQLRQLQRRRARPRPCLRAPLTNPVRVWRCCVTFRSNRNHPALSAQPLSRARALCRGEPLRPALPRVSPLAPTPLTSTAQPARAIAPVSCTPEEASQ